MHLTMCKGRGANNILEVVITLVILHNIFCVLKWFELQIVGVFILLVLIISVWVYRKRKLLRSNNNIRQSEVTFTETYGASCNFVDPRSEDEIELICDRVWFKLLWFCLWQFDILMSRKILLIIFIFSKYFWKS